MSDNEDLIDNGVVKLSPEATDEKMEESTSDDSEDVYTVEEAVEHLGFGAFQIIVTLFSGLIWVADAMELMLLSVLSPAARCDWDLSHVEEALITSVVFVGFLIGGIFWGAVCDMFGRKKGLLVIDIVILGFGILSAVQISPDRPDGKLPGYPWLLICRFGVGIGAGGTSQAVTYYTEFLPMKARGVCITLLEVWWAIGSMFGALLAVLVMEPLGWHYYLGLATIPLVLVLPLFLLVPESARYYVVDGKPDAARNVLERIACLNRKCLPKGRIVSQEEKDRLKAKKNEGPASDEDESTLLSSALGGHEAHRYDSDEEINPLVPNGEGRVSLLGQPTSKKNLKQKLQDQLHLYTTLFTKGMWKTTVLLLFIWLGCAWLYYGIVLLTTSLLQYDPHCGIDESGTNTTNTTCGLDESDYLKILWTSAAELPGLLVTVVIIELIGRKFTMASEFVITGAGFLLLFICGDLYVITTFLFIIRAFATGVFQAAYVYTPEVYPTVVRGTAMGVHTAAARIGALVTPFVAQVLLHRNDYATFSLYAASGFALAVAAILLPIETKGRSLKDSGDLENKNVDKKSKLHVCC